MGKATQKTEPASLGSKRLCSKCGTKFYDFNKADITCPKCAAKVNPSQSGIAEKGSEPKKKAKQIPEEALMDSEDLVVGGPSEEFESADDLDNEEDTEVGNIEIDDDGQDY